MRESRRFLPDRSGSYIRGAFLPRRSSNTAVFLAARVQNVCSPAARRRSGRLILLEPFQQRRHRIGMRPRIPTRRCLFDLGRKVRVGETKLNSGWRRPRRAVPSPPPCDDAPCCSCLVSALFYSCAFLSSLSLFFPPSFLFPAQTSLAP